MSRILKAALVAGALLQAALAFPVIQVRPGDADDIVITEDDTLNTTNTGPIAPFPSGKPFRLGPDTQAASNGGRLPLALVNNFAGSINAYVTGLDSNGQLVMLQPDGNFFHPTAVPGASAPQPVRANVAIPLGAKGTTKTVTLPGYISAARVWFAAGNLQFYTVQGGAGPSLVEPSATNPSDPSAAVNWGFVELTNIANGGLFANISYVDFVGLVLGMSLRSVDGSVQTAQGLRADAVATICASLIAQGQRDGQPWGDLCQVDGSGRALRVIAPSDYVAANPGAFANYWTNYVNQVWSYYTTNTLTIDTQTGSGKVACRVQGDVLTCAGDNRGYARPNAGDIFGCNSGPFAIQGSDNGVHRAVVPRLCAAFDRTTLLSPGGNVQPALPSTSYYKSDPTNWYSAFVHANEVDGRGYAFSYDDVNPSGENQSGVVANPNPQTLTVTIGGPN